MYNHNYESKSPRAAQLTFGEQSTLLTRTWKKSMATMWVSYLLLMAAVQAWERHGDFLIEDICTERASSRGGSSEVCMPAIYAGCHVMKHNRAYIWSEFNTGCQAFSVGAFFASVALQTVRLLASSHSHPEDKNVSFHSESVYTTMGVALLAGGSELLILTGGDQQITCTDVIGVSVPLMLYIEWFSTVPFLVYIALAIDSKVGSTVPLVYPRILTPPFAPHP